MNTSLLLTSPSRLESIIVAKEQTCNPFSIRDIFDKHCHYQLFGVFKFFYLEALKPEENQKHLFSGLLGTQILNQMYCFYCAKRKKPPPASYCQVQQEKVFYWHNQRKHSPFKINGKSLTYFILYVAGFFVPTLP